MELRRDTWIAAVRLAAVVSIVAAVAAVLLSTIASVEPVALVVAVMVVGFVASWIETGRVRHRAAQHRLAVVPLRRPVA